MRPLLLAYCTAILGCMLILTIVASLDRGVLTAAAQLWPDPWFKATLADAYFAFLTIYLWVAYKERSWRARAVWLVLFLTLGNFAIAAYLLRELMRLRATGFNPEALLLRRP